MAETPKFRFSATHNGAVHKDGDVLPMGASEICSVLNKQQAEIERLRKLTDIGSEMAGHITRPIALGMPFDRDVLRHWANRYHTAKREAT